jgi:hypothetical protein
VLVRARAAALGRVNDRLQKVLGRVVNTDGRPSQAYFNATPQQLPDALATKKYPLKKGSVIDPVH